MSAVDGAHSWIELCLWYIERRHLRLIFCPIIHHATWANRPNNQQPPSTELFVVSFNVKWCVELICELIVVAVAVAGLECMPIRLECKHWNLCNLLWNHLEFRFPILFSGLYHTMLTTKAKVAIIVEANSLDDRWQHGLFRRSGQERLLIKNRQCKLVLYKRYAQL